MGWEYDWGMWLGSGERVRLKMVREDNDPTCYEQDEAIILRVSEQDKDNHPTYVMSKMRTMILHAMSKMRTMILRVMSKMRTVKRMILRVMNDEAMTC
eukprot:306128-Amorphochlora_amoeboformis.AAC.1